MGRYAVQFLLAALVVLAGVSLRRALAASGDLGECVSHAVVFGNTPVPQAPQARVSKPPAVGTSPVPLPPPGLTAVGTSPVPLPPPGLTAVGTSPMPLPPPGLMAVGTSPMPLPPPGLSST